MSDKKAQQVLKELFIRCGKLHISVCFLTQSYFSVPKDVRLNCTHYSLLITTQPVDKRIKNNFNDPL